MLSDERHDSPVTHMLPVLSDVAYQLCVFRENERERECMCERVCEGFYQC